jgi:hypothetical protein
MKILYSSPSIIRMIKSRRMRWAGHVASRETGEVHTGFWWGQGETTWKPRHRREDNIETNLQKLGWGMDWIDLAQDRDRWRSVLNAVMNLRVP